MTEAGVFVRKATGLTREVGLWSAISFNIGIITVLQSCGITMPYFINYGNGGNWILGVIIGGVAGLAVNLVYAHFTAAMPRAGGEYVFLGRTMSPLLGLVVNFVNVCTYMFWWTGDVIFQSDMVRQFASSLFFVPRDSLNWIGTPWGTWLVGLVLMSINAAIAIFGLKLYLRITNIIWAIVIVALPVTAYYFLAATGSFPALFNAWALKYVPTQPDMYNKIINDAAAAGFSLMKPEGPGLEQTLIVAAIFFTMISPWGIMTTYISGELKRADSGLRQVAFAISAIFWSIVAYIVIGQTWMNMAGLKFVGSLATIGGGSPSAYTEGVPINVLYWSFPQIVAPYWAMALFAIAIFGQYAIVCEASKVISVSRCVLSWSFDRVFPTRLAHVSDRFKCPDYAIAIEYVLALVLLSMAVTVNIWLYIAAAAFWGIFNMIVVCVAGIIFPYVKKDMYEAMPLKVRVAGIPLLSIIALIGAALVAWTSISYFVNPSFAASFGVTPVVIGSTILIYAAPVAIFIASRRYWRAKGIDLNLAFREIPPA